jgi:arsenate reductase-like glutaredoxin family protein
MDGHYLKFHGGCPYAEGQGDSMNKHFLIIAIMCGFLLSAFAQEAAMAGPAEEIEKPVKKSINIRQKTQKKEDQWADKKAKLVTEYKNLCQENENLIIENRNLKKEFKTCQKDIASFKAKIAAIEVISNELEPYLAEVLERLEKSVRTGLPFLMSERKTRLQKLRKFIEKPDTSSAELFRRIMEAVLVEAEYGNTVEVYREKINLNEKQITVSVFRLGRISLFFKTPDNRLTGYFNPGAGKWMPLPEKYNREIGNAIEIAAKRRAIELVTLPVGRIAAK